MRGRRQVARALTKMDLDLANHASTLSGRDTRDGIGPWDMQEPAWSAVVHLALVPRCLAPSDATCTMSCRPVQAQSLAIDIWSILSRHATAEMQQDASIYTSLGSVASLNGYTAPATDFIIDKTVTTLVPTTLPGGVVSSFTTTYKIMVLPNPKYFGTSTPPTSSANPTSPQPKWAARERARHGLLDLLSDDRRRKMDQWWRKPRSTRNSSIPIPSCMRRPNCKAIAHFGLE